MRVLIVFALLASTIPALAVENCPATWVCVPRHVYNLMSPDERTAAIQLARHYGVRWAVVEPDGRQRRGVLKK